ncbi:hypothetical protein ANN_17653 [Periplaneta americana]|uniref:HTH psq-type domain-containing protein n=1 Tax=Periplaneta americana TaxID=6978 RepID=A0ABQ8SUH8_PERAM|nr:hypothetical protein ANN_17653 [Periplaneta americana]
MSVLGQNCAALFQHVEGVIAEYNVGNKLLALSLGSPVVGLPLLASGQACNAAFPLHLMKQLYRCDSVAISSLVETGWTTEANPYIDNKRDLDADLQSSIAQLSLAHLNIPVKDMMNRRGKTDPCNARNILHRKNTRSGVYYHRKAKRSVYLKIILHWVIHHKRLSTSDLYAMDKKKVSQITNEENWSIIEEVDPNPHMKRIDIARKLNIPPSTLNMIVSKRKTIEAMYSEEKVANKNVCEGFISSEESPSLYAMDKKKVRQITNEENWSIIEEVDPNPHMKRIDIARKLNIPPSTLNMIVSKRKTIEAMYSEEKSGKQKCVCEGQFPELENVLLKWFKQVHASNTPIDGTVVCAKSPHLALQMELSDFKASKG